MSRGRVRASKKVVRLTKLGMIVLVVQHGFLELASRPRTMTSDVLPHFFRSVRMALLIGAPEGVAVNIATRDAVGRLASTRLVL